jgi:hypothetical protein
VSREIKLEEVRRGWAELKVSYEIKWIVKRKKGKENSFLRDQFKKKRGRRREDFYDCLACRWT